MLRFLAVVASLALSSASPPQHQNHLVPQQRADPIDYRLPVVFNVNSYTIRLVPYIVEGNFTFDGSVIINVTPLIDTNNITLNADKLDIDTNQITVKQLFLGTDVAITGTLLMKEAQIMVINLAEELQAGVQYAISFKKFTGILDDDMLGFYRSSYVEAGERRWMAITQFESTNARRAFPCFDEPTFKATVKLSISRAANLRSIANMPQEGKPELDTENTDEVRYWDHFQSTPVISTYLIAFAVSDFVYLENAAKSFRIFAQAPLINQARYSLSVSPTILQWLGDFTGIPFQLPKMDEVAVPDFDLGAMENWGLVTYRERLILLGDGVSGTSSKQKIATIVAHEFSHQWFGDLVTPVWWKYLWLNEGFATYFEHFAMAEIEPTWRLEDQFVPIMVQSAMSGDSSQSSHPMSYDVESPASISALFDSITYAKAGSVLRMLSHIVSPATFRRGLNRYLLDMSYSNAHPDDLFANLNSQLHEDNNEVSEVDIKTIMDTWTLQMGFPVVNVTRDYTANTAVLTQDRFLLKKIEDHPDTHVYKWHIPLTYTTQDNPDFDMTLPIDWFNAEDETKTLNNMAASDKWVIFNIQGTGYYRVNYDDKNWGLIQSHLTTGNVDDINVLNRAQLLDDAFNLARAGLVEYSTALSLSLYLEREVDYIAWTSAFTAFSFIDDKISSAIEYNVFQEYMLKLINKLYTTVGFDEDVDDGHVLKLNRAAAVVWACHLKETDCVTKSVDGLASWMATPSTNPIKPDIKSGVYCTGIREGDKTEWDFLWGQYLITNVATETSILISALGCSNDAPTLRTYLETAVTEGSAIRKQDASAVFGSVYNNPDGGVDVALDYLIEDFQKISQYFGGFNALGKLIINIANKCNTREQADKLTQFLNDNTDQLASAVDAARRAVEIVEENLEWQITNGQEIIDWIKAEGLTNQNLV